MIPIISCVRKREIGFALQCWLFFVNRIVLKPLRRSPLLIKGFWIGATPEGSHAKLIICFKGSEFVVVLVHGFGPPLCPSALPFLAHLRLCLAEEMEQEEEEEEEALAPVPEILHASIPTCLPFALFVNSVVPAVLRRFCSELMIKLPNSRNKREFATPKFE